MVTAGLAWYEMVGRLGLALVLGAMIGAERELDGQDAGLRTHALLSIGCALFALVSVAGFDQFVTDSTTNVNVDVTRVAAYVAGGVGFIGGGVIMKHRTRIAGLTTAASLWTVAAIGVACGIGFWVGALAATVLSVAVLGPLERISRRVRARSRRSDPDGDPVGG
ncbi:MAG TPA: MgtC/SapB family protein [Ilumatobacteraceae bacterium]|nr:MgtC/SapB family protein [Ilumatobacteraceae bacterium]